MFEKNQVRHWCNTFIHGALIPFILLLVIMISIPCFAGDGQIDILPSGSATFDINAPGSYVLTGNVTMTTDDACIWITTNDVTLDLGGHTITGTGSGSSAGIVASSYDRIRLFNGRIQSFGGHGASLGEKSLVNDLIVSSNGKDGINVGKDSRLVSVIADNNTENGIFASSCCVIDKCTASENAKESSYSGIEAGEGSVVTNCTARANGNSGGTYNIDVAGIKVESGSTVIGCASTYNRNQTTYNGGEVAGIMASGSCVIKDNACYMNSSSSLGTKVYGIKCIDNCVIMGNSISGNISNGSSGAMYGIWFDEQCSVADNCVNENEASGSKGRSYGIYANGSGNIIRNNNCSDNTSTSMAAGIYLGDDRCRVSDNLCTNNESAGSGYGIVCVMSNFGHVIVRNHSVGNTSAGINLGNGHHYCADNTSQQSMGVMNTTNCSLGSGDHANINFL